MNLVVIQNRSAVTSSLVVAESFEKEHRNVLRDIENIKKDVLNFEQMFFEGTSPDSYGRERKVYYMNRKGFTFLSMGFTGTKARKFQLSYIDAFDQMEQQLLDAARPSYEISNPVERAKKWIEEHQLLIEANNVIEEQKPKVLYAEAVMASEDSIEVGTLSKLLAKNGINIGRNILFEWLRENGYLKKEGKTKNEPMQRYINQGWFEVVLKPFFKNDGTPSTGSKTMVTAKGQNELINLFLKFNIKENN